MSTGPALLAAACAAGVAALCLGAPGAGRAGRRDLALPATTAPPQGPPPDVGPRRWRWAAAGSALVGVLTLAPGPVVGTRGVGALAAAVGVFVLASRAEPASVRRDRLAAARQLPHLVELFAAALTAGAAPASALERACAALPGPAAELLGATRAALALGVGPEEMWSGLAAHPVLGPLGRALERAHRSGAPITEVVRRLADDLAAEARLDAEDRARQVGVRAAVPLGLCLLPAFLLLGIVPVVAGAISAIRW